MCDRPGRGGITRGPGAAKLTFGDPTKEDEQKFKEEALPEGDLASLKRSQVVAISRGTPGNEAPGGPAGSGALDRSAAGGGSANTQVVLPRHRGTVERYFERPAK
jgi:hypothetical protein